MYRSVLFLLLCVPSLTAQQPAIKAPANVPAFELVRIDVSPAMTPKDVMVMAVIQGEVRFLEVVETTSGQFVFTGPPGRYSIRVTVASDRGFAYATGNVVIGDGQPVQPQPPPVQPVQPQPPVPQPPPVDGAVKPPGEGVYGFGPVVFKEAFAIRAKHAASLQRLAENFEWAATAEVASLEELIKKLGDRNLPLYVPEGDWAAYRGAWLAQANRLRENGILPDTLDDHRIVFRETAAGLRAALK